jgi:hypothetical protein
MNLNIRERFARFIKSPKEYPVLAGFMAGFYAIVFYYSNNVDLANSLELFAFFTSYFIVLPVVVCFSAFALLKVLGFQEYVRQVLFVIMLSFFGFYILFHFVPNVPLAVFVIGFLALVLLSFKFRNYKVAIALIAVMSVLPLAKLSLGLGRNFLHNSHWNRQPDNIEDCKFTIRPNVYFLQVDGYASAAALRNEVYHYDNSAFDAWLQSNGFTVYDNYRSNYNSTLTSNASCFNMKHHYFRESTAFKDSRDYIVGENPVLDIFKNNHYKRTFITERPYLLMNRPKLAFDYCNIDLSKLPYFWDGMTEKHDISKELKADILANGRSGNFYFVEKFDPGHINVSKVTSQGKVKERERYLGGIEAANAWLKDIVPFIRKYDDAAIIIVGADHGGYVGFDYTQQANAPITDKKLFYSIFGARMAIKWNDPQHVVYDKGLKSAVNLFRTVFSFLGKDTDYLKNLQPDVSYNNYQKEGRMKVYSAIKE